MTHKEVFVKEFSKFKSKDIKIMLLITILLNCIALIFDYLVSGPDFIYFFIDRFVINCGIALFLIIFFNNKYIKKYFVYIGFGIYIITGLGQIFLLLAQCNVYYFATLFLLLLSGMLLFFVAYIGTFMINLVFVIVFSVVQYINYSDDMVTWLLSVSILLAYVLMIFIISYFLHKNISSIFFETDKIKKDNKKLKQNVIKSECLIKKLNYDSIYSLAIIAESHDDFTGKHLQRVGELSKNLAEKLPKEFYDADKINKSIFIENIELASTLHDLGKIDIPMRILKKRGPLTDKERKVIQTHSIKGFEILTNISSLYDNNEIMTLAKEIARYHHENWDGSGYPDKISQLKIPLSARIVSITDYYDALTQDRPYRKALDKTVVKQMLIDNCGVKFDPTILEIFCSQI